jgi:RNA polymerase sigma factor (sigma-70 family)
MRLVLAEVSRATDRDLLNRFACSQDEAAFEVLVRRHGALVMSVARRVLGNEADAEDIFQTTFLLLAWKAASTAWQESVAGWLHRTAHHLACKARSAAQRRARHEKLAAPPGCANPLAQMTARELLAVLDEELLRLPDRYRVPLVLCYLKGATRDEAARELGCPPATVKSRLARGRDRLHRALERRGLTLAGVLGAVGVAGTTPAVGGEAVRAVTRAAVTRVIGGGLQAMLPSKVRMAWAALLLCSVFSGMAVWGFSARPQTPIPDRPSTTARQRVAQEESGKLSCGGRVLSPEGKPVAGARVVFLRHAVDEGGGFVPVAAAEALTGADGKFAFVVPPPEGSKDPLPRGGTLLAGAAGHAPGWVRIDRPEQARDATVRLVKEVALEGRVVDLQGKPVAGASVQVVQLQAHAREDLGPWYRKMAAEKVLLTDGYPNIRIAVEALGPGRVVRTDAKGAFRIRGLGRDRLAVLRFSAPAIETRDVHAITRRGAAISGIILQKGNPEFGNYTVLTNGFTHVAAPTRPVVGTVTDRATAKPLSGVVVQARLPNTYTRSGGLTEATTDAQGRYRLVGLPRGAGHTVTAAPAVATGYLPAGKPTPRTSDLDPARLDFALTRGVVIRGRVTDKVTSKPVRARVEYLAFGNNPHLKTTGAFRDSRTNATLNGPDGTFTLLGLPGRGIVTATVPRKGEHAGVAARYLVGIGADAVARLGRLEETRPRAVDPSWTNALAGLDVEPGKREVTCALLLDPGKTVKGRVVGPDGKPVAGVRVDRTSGHTDSADAPGSDGRFTFGCVDPQRARAFLFRHDEKKLGAVVMIRGDRTDEVTVKLQPYGTLLGRLVDTDGTPLAGWRVSGIVEANQFGFDRGWVGFFQPTTDKDGKFHIDFLAGLRLGASARSAKGRIARAFEKIILEPGKTRDLGNIEIGPS